MVEKKSAGTSPVATERRGRILVLRVDNPPVNALSARVRAGLLQALRDATEAPEVEGIVIGCAGRTFIAGADIKEFGQPPVPPSSAELFAAIESCAKPVVAAIHGHALGGGLELALCCHGRVAAPGTRLGLTEITLGLLPGCGGVQRLARLVDPGAAARLVLSGSRIDAQEAFRLGLLDQAPSDDWMDAAIRLAQHLAAAPSALRRLSTQPFGRAPSDGWRADVERIAREVRSADRAPMATRACMEALVLAAEAPFEQALKREREMFLDLLQGRESRALRHNFLAERAAGKPPAPAATAREVRRIAIVGAGTMGRGIAVACAGAGYQVRLLDANGQALEAAVGAIARIHSGWVDRGRLTAEQAAGARDAITAGDQLSAAADADLVIEAVFEEMPLKQSVFRELDAIARPGAVLASNTSTLDVDVIADVTRRPADVLGMHFFSPAHVMRLLEVIRGRRTAPDVLATALDVGRRIGKLPVVVGVCEGFVANRMALARGRQVEALLEEGATPAQIDRVARAFGFAMGPCETSDLAGLDITWRIRKANGRRAPVADALCERGRFGQKVGRGYYRYAPGERAPIEDEEVLQLLQAVSGELGIARRTVDDAEVEDRLVLPLVNEGARILEEGIAARAGDIDVIFVNGYGWPVRRGGPMFHADETGLPEVCRRLEALARRGSDPSLEPAPLLRRLAHEGRGFSTWQAPAA